MGQFSRFLQCVIVAKDKGGAYVPKKYIVKRHGSGYLNGSTEWLNDALDGDYERLVTEHGLEELSTGKSVHKDFTENSIAGAFHLESLPKFILDKDGNLRLFERGKYRIGLWKCKPIVETEVLKLPIKTIAEILSRSRLVKRHGGRGFWRETMFRLLNQIGSRASLSRVFR